MRISERNGVFEDFFEHRSYLIMQYSQGDLNKKEFIKRNFDYLVLRNMTPYIKVDSYEKGMYNYQYFNVMAKYYKALSRDVYNTKKHQKYYNYYLNLANKFYHEKDKSVLSILKIEEFKDMDAYYIKCQSKALQNLLYEIVLNNKKEAIFHSKAKWLLNVLIEEKIFNNVTKKSIIDHYINEKCY